MYRDEYGINIHRRKRQAGENTKIVLEQFISDILNKIPIVEGELCIKSIDKMNYWVENYAQKTKNLAKSIEIDWAIPILIESIARLYYGDLQKYKEFGPVYKSAVAYIWGAKSTANMFPKRSVGSLVELLKMCYMLEGINSRGPLFYFCENYYCQIDNGYLEDKDFKDQLESFHEKMAGRGMRLRIAKDNNSVMHDPMYMLELREILLNNKKPSDVEMFKGLFYEKIPGIENSTCKQFWQTLFFRANMYYYFMASEGLEEIEESGGLRGINPKVSFFPEYTTQLAEGLYTQETVTRTFWRRDWYNKQDVTRYSQLLVERPILRITDDGDFVTSSVLIGDSINLYIEDSIMNYSDNADRAMLPPDVYKKTISEPFEDKIINEMVNLGFEAGHVSEKGNWHKCWLDGNAIKSADENLIFDENEKIYGEVDVFAFRQDLNLAILIECKVIHDYRDLRTFKNMVGKLIDDSEGFRAKLKNKAAWLERALIEKKKTKTRIVKILLTDIKMPVEDDSEDIILVDENTLVSRLAKLLQNGDIVQDGVQ